MTTVAVIQARHTSTRLPGKMLLPLAGVPVIAHIIERARSVSEIDRICVTIPDGPAQAPLGDYVKSLDGVHLSVGPEENLLRRFANAARESDADQIVRLWGDCPAVDPAAIRHLLTAFGEGAADWAFLSDGSGYPLGYGCQVYKREALLAVDAEATNPADQEFVHSFFQRYPARFGFINVMRPGNGFPVPSPLHLLLDTPSDYRKLGKIFDRLYPAAPLFGLSDVETLASAAPSLF